MTTIPTRLFLGFLAGFLAHLIFQGAFGSILYAAHLLCALALFDQLVLPEPEAPEKSGPFVIDELPRSRRPGASTKIGGCQVRRSQSAN